MKMNQPEKPKMRIVSKAKYVAHRGKKGLLGLSGLVLVIAAWLGGCCGLLICFWLLIWGIIGVYYNPPIGILTTLIVLGLGWLIVRLGTFFSHQGLEMIDNADRTDDVIPFTKANIAYIHAEESLLRASAEPVEAQSSTLLRAATTTNDAPAEQLLRPANEQEA
jgi:hypothetical protein